MEKKSCSTSELASYYIIESYKNDKNYPVRPNLFDPVGQRTIRCLVVRASNVIRC